MYDVYLYLFLLNNYYFYADFGTNICQPMYGLIEDILSKTG